MTEARPPLTDTLPSEPLGRKCTFTRELGRTIVEGLCLFLSFDDAARRAGVRPATAKQWLKKGRALAEGELREFADDVTYKPWQIEDSLDEQFERPTRDQSAWRPRAKALVRRRPADYGTNADRLHWQDLELETAALEAEHGPLGEDESSPISTTIDDDDDEDDNDHKEQESAKNGARVAATTNDDQQKDVANGERAAATINNDKKKEAVNGELVASEHTDQKLGGERKRAGRSTKCTPMFVQMFLDKIRAGRTFETACGALRVHPSTVWKWIAKGKRNPDGPYGEFHDAYEQADAESVAYDLAIIRSAADAGDRHAYDWLRTHAYRNRGALVEKEAKVGRLKLKAKEKKVAELKQGEHQEPVHWELAVFTKPPERPRWVPPDPNASRYDQPRTIPNPALAQSSFTATTTTAKGPESQ